MNFKRYLLFFVSFFGATICSASNDVQILSVLYLLNLEKDNPSKTIQRENGTKIGKLAIKGKSIATTAIASLPKDLDQTNIDQVLQSSNDVQILSVLYLLNLEKNNPNKTIQRENDTKIGKLAIKGKSIATTAIASLPKDLDQTNIDAVLAGDKPATPPARPESPKPAAGGKPAGTDESKDDTTGSTSELAPAKNPQRVKRGIGEAFPPRTEYAAKLKESNNPALKKFKTSGAAVLDSADNIPAIVQAINDEMPELKASEKDGGIELEKCDVQGMVTQWIAKTPHEGQPETLDHEVGRLVKKWQSTSGGASGAAAGH